MPKIVHIHIPRTGGTSIKKLMDLEYGARHVFSFVPYPQHLNSPLGVYINSSSSTWYTNRNAFLRDWYKMLLCSYRSWSQYNVFHGHHPAQLYNGIPEFEDAYMFAVVRNPVDLLLSWWQWELGFPRFFPDATQDIYEFIEEESRRNIQFRMVEGGNIDVHLLMHERFEEDVALLASDLGWGDYELPHANWIRKKEPRTELLADGKLASRIYELNSLDLGIWRRVKECHHMS